nr:hypothetical protein [Tanacetum cinerariifolium]
RLGVYTAKDYADILEFLVGRWKVSDLTGLSGEGRKAQEYVCGLPPRIRRLEERVAGRKAQEYVCGLPPRIKRLEGRAAGNEDAVFRHKCADLKNENGVAYDLIHYAQRLNFLLDMSNYLLRLQKEYPNCSFLTTMKSLPVGSGWMSLIDNDWKKDMFEGPKSSMYLEDTPRLLQLIRNTSHQIWKLTHFRGRDRRWLEKHVSSTYPSLFMDVYNKGKECATNMFLQPPSVMAFKVCPEHIEITNEKVAFPKEKLREARSRQNSYADKHRRDLEFQVGDHVFLKVSPFRGVKCFGIKGKLSPRFIGPFKILERIGEVSYRLALPPQLSHVHNVFHVSLLRGYHYHPLHVTSYPFDQIQPDMSLSEEPESILDRQERVMRNKTVSFVKIFWKNHPEREATWETKESMRASYPRFFS